MDDIDDKIRANGKICLWTPKEWEELQLFIRNQGCNPIKEGDTFYCRRHYKTEVKYG